MKKGKEKQEHPEKKISKMYVRYLPRQIAPKRYAIKSIKHSRRNTINEGSNV
ncbi:hypothetical protein [Legionella wadsworthii]|uniref:hypothetical protein n=1 Tax=Legionella wadsworthii TaxID=28088 RepID=UPI0015583EC9|nr:hypothetical protein [Legionella wadsworthii]